MQKYTKIQASVQHGLYLFTCEIHSFNSRPPQAANLLNLAAGRKFDEFGRSKLEFYLLVDWGGRGEVPIAQYGFMCIYLYMERKIEIFHFFVFYVLFKLLLTSF